jgi:hypothetical protein
MPFLALSLREEFMEREGRLGQLSATLLGLIVLLMSAPGVWAQSEYKSLHRFTQERGGSLPRAGLVLDRAGNLVGTTTAGGDLGACGGSGCGTVFKLVANADRSQWRERVLHRFAGLDGSLPSADLILDHEGNLYGTTEFGGSGPCSYGVYSGCGTVFELTFKTGVGWTEKVLYDFTGQGDGYRPLASLVFDRAGNLYGTTFQGGSGANCFFYQSCGTVFKLTPNSDGSWTESVLHAFCSVTNCLDGMLPATALTLDAAGNLYGVTSAGGGTSGCSDGCGTVFELIPVSGGWKEQVLHYFAGRRDGSLPYGRLIFDQSGNLYGTTYVGGLGSICGIAFKLVPESDGTWRKEVLHTFTCGPDGGLPDAGLTMGADGSLYGTMLEGGSFSNCDLGCGVVFKLLPNPNGAWREIMVLHRFFDRPGDSPYAGVILDTSGNVYGTTYGDDTTTFGSVFEIKP